MNMFRRSIAILLCFACWTTYNGNIHIQAARQNPLKDSKICGQPQCDPNSSKFGYGDKIYKYDYSFSIRTEFSGTGENTSDLFIKAGLDLFFPKPCEGFLRINNVQLWDTEQSNPGSVERNNVYDYYDELNEPNMNSEEQDFPNQHPKSSSLSSELKKHILRFAFHDGQISEVCPSVEEAAWSLNFKKGILSAFQNTMMRFDVDYNTTESDVSGECNVQYSLESTENAFMSIRKIKDIASCKNRYSTHSMLQSVPYTFRDDKTIWPILNSESYCNMTIDNNIYRSISCHEKHQLIPFSNSSSGATTLTDSKLDLQGEESYSSSELLTDGNGLIEKRSTLFFDHTPITKPSHGEIRASRDLLKEMCALGLPNIQREFIDVFTNFLQTTKSLDYKALSQLLARSASICEYGKNHVLESLPYIGSSASYRLMRDQIIANVIPKRLAHSWMISLSFTIFPDEDTLDTFATILDYSRKKIDPEYTLGASAVVHNYCVHNSNCEQSSKVQNIIEMLETEFQNQFNMYNGERRSRERMAVILKGLGNIGVISNPFAEQLKEIIEENSIAPVDMRLQAVLTFRRVNCVQYRSFFLSIYSKTNINSEVRILSYLQAMRCPDYKLIKKIRTILESEEVNQVGSFVWSHLKNLAKSSSPINIEVQGLLLDNNLTEKFKLDIRKFSRNFEHSLFFDEYNFGTTTDMNLIFGTESYLPRMVNLNFTTHLFGQSVNFFELSLRAQGFEELTASVFGPNGPLNREVFRKKLASLNRWLGNESADGEDELDHFLDIANLRLKREINDGNKNASNESHKQLLQADIDSLGYNLKYEYDNPRTQFGLRIFGNDLCFYSKEGILEIMALFKEFDPFYQASKVLSGKEVKHSDSRVFLDVSYNVPLAIGIPLAIHAFGAASIDLRMSGNLERISDWNFNVEGRFKPSIILDVIVKMHSDLFYAASGIKVKSNLYSNSEVEAKLKVRGKNLVSFSFNLPQDKNEIFSARSELLVMKDSKSDISQTGISARRENSSCTWPVLNEAIGLKMCSFYSVPDLSNTSGGIYPSLILSGPLNFSILLTKSDLTAKKYVFEYKWDQEGANSNWSIVYHTPESLIKRILVANITSESEAFNASVAFMNGNQTAAAGCNLNLNDPENRSLDIFLDTNGNRSFDLNVELKRWQERTAWVYKPKMLLTVKGVNITGLVGVLRFNEKNGISQNDIELSFETKKLQALIRGNIVRSEITTSTNMTVNYRFQANKIETINVEGKLVNSGDKSKTEYRGNIKLKTSAYPKLNFASNATWLSLQGHTEGVLTYNNAVNFEDPQYTNLIRMIFARSQSEEQIWEGSRTRASLEVNIPRSKIDYRILVKHEERTKNGTEHNIILGLRYAPEKEATGIFSIHFPRRNLFAVDAYVNVSIPEFNFCEARLKLTETIARDYLMNFNGSWFTGHNIAIKGNYKDRSSRVQALHHLKLIIESPSFQSTSLNIVYRRNQLIMFFDAQGKYENDPYGLTMQYSINANKNSNAELRLKIREKLYWLNTKLLSEQPKLLQVELHLDKLRDIHIKIGILTLEQRKEVSLELKWDANRDPSQRLGLLAEYNHLEGAKYNGNVMLSYPERTISFGFETNSRGPKYHGTIRATWSVNEMVVFKYDVGILPGRDINSWLHADLATPFDGWKTNSFKAGIYNVENLILSNATLLWANDQSLELGYKSDYEITDSVIRFHIRFGVNSTIRDIPTLNILVKHWQNIKRVDTELALRYFSSPNDTLINVYNIKSNWELFENERFQNISGIVVMISPFEGYRKGGLAAKFSLSDQRELLGAASLNFDIREFTLAMNGYVKKFTDNMLTVNITTPLEKFRTINGRIGLNEKRRHAVAEIRAPTSALGIEALCDIVSLMNFDVKLSLATPIETFQRAGLFAKINAETVDMRGVMNNITIGFSGVWRNHNATDFEYSYRVFTPLHGFEENGFIAKFIKKEIFVLELHGKLSTYKLGVKINGHPKSKLLNQLGSEKIELEILYDLDFQPQKTEDDIEDYDVDYDEFFSYFLEFALDTIIWPTIDGLVDVQEVTDFYLVVGNVELPQGRIDVKNRLHFPDYINLLNVLNLKSPFSMARDVKCIFEYHTNLDFNAFYERIDITVNNNRNHIMEIGAAVNYTKVEDPLKPRRHEIYLRLQTPFNIPAIEIAGKIELDDNFYKGNISSKTMDTFLSVAGSLETDENFVETSIGILLASNVVPYYHSKMYFKRDFSEIDNSIDIHFEVLDNATTNKIEVGCNWHKSVSNFINANGRFHTTIIPLQTLEASILLTKSENPQFSLDFIFVNQDGERKEVGSRAIKKNDAVNIEIWTPMELYKNISIHSSFVQISSNPIEYKISGKLYRDLAIFDLSGMVQMDKAYPVNMHIQMRPKSREQKEGSIELKITSPENSNDKSIQIRAINGAANCHIVGSYAMNNGNGLTFSADIQSTEAQFAHINVFGKTQPKGNGHVISEFALKTPWKYLGIESVKLQSDIEIQTYGGIISAKYAFDENVGSCGCDWSWIFLRDMQINFENSISHVNSEPRLMHFNSKYTNPEQNFQNLLTNLKLNVDHKWNLELNNSINIRSKDDLQVDLIAKLPLPIEDKHYLNLRYHGNIISQQGVNANVFIETKYRSLEAKRKFVSRLNFRNMTDLHGMGHAEWGKGDNTSIIEGDFQLLRKQTERREFYAKLTTPLYKNESTLFLKGNYDITANDYRNLICSIDCPASAKIFDADLSFKSISDMYGFLNTTTPFNNASWIKAEFNFSTDSGYRYLRGSWPTDTAFFKMHNIYTSKNNADEFEGEIAIEVPLATRHKANVGYSMKGHQEQDNGEVKVVYNRNQILLGLYKRSKNGTDENYTDTTFLTLENAIKPLGIHYTTTHTTQQINQFTDIKHVEVFELNNVQNFNLTGELHNYFTPNGQEIKIVAVHPNRTVVFTTVYDDKNKRMINRRSKLELSSTVWIGYNFRMENFTAVGNESQKLIFEISYPRRTLTTEGWYWYASEEQLQSNVNFKWTSDNENTVYQKELRTGLIWKMEPLSKGDRDHQTFLFKLEHPNLNKAVVIQGSFYRSLVELLNVDLTVDYSTDPNHLIKLGVLLNDLHPHLGYTNYTLKMFASHAASELDCLFYGTAAALPPSYYRTESYAHYKRDYYPDKHGNLLALIDLNKKEVEYERNSPYHSVRFWVKPSIQYPIYGVNATVWNTPDTNNTGYMFIDLKRKYVRMEVNLTDDASQNLQMVGTIPDTRGGYLEVWRNYEEIRVIDVNSYLRMNHSRLITGKLHWRPKIKEEIKSKIHGIGESIYNSFSEGIDFWIKSIYMESVDAVGAVWKTAKDYNEPFFDEMGELSVLEDDLAVLRLFLNQSYEANDFYIKTVVNFTLTILDELAIRDHIESLPKIVTEIWQAMGDSGKALRNSVLWLIEAVKKTYNNIMEIINRFFHGESLYYISTILEKGVEKYDKFVKDLHISFIKYVENLWNKFLSMLEKYLKVVLKRLEPHVFKFMSYVETTAWEFFKEVFDFIYERTNELADSPYFNKVSTFTQDIDRLYRDIKSHDAIRNLKKYTTIAWNFLKEKYFKLVPFGTELNLVLTEIWDEIRELEKIEQVQLLLQKYNEVLLQLEWIAKELQLESRLHELYTLIRNQFYATNALETDDRYREAKTKFIFDPEAGIIDLEQKLPMSWHSFNETPKFEEIPEYKILAQAQNFFSTTNTSIVSYIYNLRSHLDPKSWLPPYYARALLIDSRHYMTFDQRFVGLNLKSKEIDGEHQNTQCSYILTHDFHQKNFSLVLEPSTNTLDTDEIVSPRKLKLIVNGQLLEIDLGNNNLTINGDRRPVLPLLLVDVIISIDRDILSIQSKTEFNLHCNMQFHLCWIEISGWYFGHTAGLLGTSNNEPFDEFMTSRNIVTADEQDFTDSWSLHKCRQETSPLPTTISDNVMQICQELFLSGIFSTCAEVIEVTPFYNMCLDLSVNANPIKKGHPVVKGACTAALAYIEACNSAKIPLRVPHQCVFCQLTNGAYVSEGTFVEISGNAVPKSSDIVFIVEAKPCNDNIMQNKSIMLIATGIEEQLKARGITNNRYAVMAFGGRAPFDKPRNIIRENRIFVTEFSDLEKYFAHIEVHNSTYNDILQAISAASKLNFRPGVAKTFILLSCSKCAAQHMLLDYTSILQYMLEEGVNLHILADTEFEFERTRNLRHFFGMDKELVYSKRYPEGDAAIRQQLHIAKSNLGICTPLAFETNGSVFSARKLSTERKQRFVTIFAKRVAKSTVPNLNQTCECSGHNSGVSYMMCSPTSYPEEKFDAEDYDLQFDNWDWKDEDEY